MSKIQPASMDSGRTNGGKPRLSSSNGGGVGSLDFFKKDIERSEADATSSSLSAPATVKMSRAERRSIKRKHQEDNGDEREDHGKNKKDNKSAKKTAKKAKIDDNEDEDEDANGSEDDGDVNDSENEGHRHEEGLKERNIRSGL
jgi:hypothetical protein